MLTLVQSSFQANLYHEVFHYCLDENNENESMDEEMEERLIFCMQWAEESLA